MADTVPSEDECWYEFWDVIGQAAYRIWRERQAAEGQAIASESSEGLAAA